MHRLVLCSGADKVSVNTAAVENPKVITELADVFGRQCVVCAIDAKRNRTPSDGKIMVDTAEGKVWFEVVTYGGSKPTGIDAVAWAMQAEKLGAGEFLVTSMDRDGTKDGYDIELTRAISERVNVPIIASGGAGVPKTPPRRLHRGQSRRGPGSFNIPLQPVPCSSCERLLA